ncbi:MAG: DUF1152 domain-containing protein [Bacteroidota bacterium]
MHHIDQAPFFTQIQNSKRILLAGAGGGFDIYSGIPIYKRLVNMGKQVVLANFSFTLLEETTTKEVYPNCHIVKSGDSDYSGRGYFPEKILYSFLVTQGIETEIYGLRRLGVKPTTSSYRYLVKKHNIDTLVLVDGGTDSFMFGDEEGLGTPQEDVCSMISAFRSGAKKQFLISLGFGVDHFHGVSHYRFLENVAELMKNEGFLGVIQLLPQMEESRLFQELVDYANSRMKGKESIVANSVLSAIQGEYGDVHRTNRTEGSELWINPLMAMYWAFDLRKVVKNIKYYDYVKDSKSIGDINTGISAYRRQVDTFREKRQIPI